MGKIAQGGGISCWQASKGPIWLGSSYDCVYFVASFTYFERLRLVIFMYHMFITNYHVACHKGVNYALQLSSTHGQFLVDRLTKAKL